ncbi:MAG: hypothetical protein WCQ48_08890 [Chloroflexota bacterium]
MFSRLAIVSSIAIGLAAVACRGSVVDQQPSPTAVRAVFGAASSPDLADARLPATSTPATTAEAALTPLSADARLLVNAIREVDAGGVSVSSASVAPVSPAVAALIQSRRALMRGDRFQLYADCTRDPQDVANDLREVGATIDRTNASTRVLQIFIPLELLDATRAVPGISLLHLAEPAPAR